jgi:hypothetical protein
MCCFLQKVLGVLILAAIALLAPERAEALPSFAAQTGQPCTGCHIGSFGPQLTPLGRAFKIGGYTQGGGEGWEAKVPLSAMLIGSFTNTAKDQPTPPAPDYGVNNNFAMDTISVFLAGRVSDHTGGFIQGTFSGIPSTSKLDTTDLRPYTTTFDIDDQEFRVGLSVNNGPTVPDPFNSSFAWGYPFVFSSLAPVPAAQPLIAGAMLGNSFGVTSYAWYDRHLYFEAGGYSTYGPTLLTATGTALGPGSTEGIAPYVRPAYEWNWNGQSAHVGGIFLHADFNPATGPQSTDTSLGRNSFTDFTADYGYQYLGDGTHVFSTYGNYTYENQGLEGAVRAGTSSHVNNDLQQVRLNTSYYYQQTYGLTLAWQRTWGTTNPLEFAPAPVTGSANGRPDSNSFTIEADWIPFGKDDSWARPWANLKLGAQYVIYTQFNGGSSNYDGFGRSASDNNTLYLFAWVAF